MPWRPHTTMAMEYVKRVRTETQPKVKISIMLFVNQLRRLAILS
ncbi:hypothetical protein AM1_4539 [Acaryochloris marina MBIC11017]|uniref:Uncharacterized protein n=1 Tax=Acaryochloris marina (strain MBIC 11017) TaxID=329726 RepID=B0BZ71_ACAM1|nr:hypothetical protein AM1_4539 [Acaryochloris marina MBIC11017]